MKRNSIYLLVIMTSTHIFTAEEPGLLSRIQTGLSNTATALTQAARNTLTGDTLVTTADSDDEGFTLVDTVNPENMAKLHRTIKKFNNEINQLASSLEQKTKESQSTITTLETGLTSMQDTITQKDELITSLQQENHDLRKKLGTENEWFEAFSLQTTKKENAEEELARLVKQYQSTMTAKNNLEQQLQDLMTQQEELLQKVHSFSRDLNRLVNENQSLKAQADTAAQNMDEEEKEYTALLHQHQDQMRTLQAQNNKIEEEKAILKQVLETILKQAAQDNDALYNKEFTQNFLQALAFSENLYSQAVNLLFPLAGNEEVFES